MGDRVKVAESLEAKYADFTRVKGIAVNAEGADAWDAFADACEANLPTILASLRASDTGRSEAEASEPGIVLRRISREEAQARAQALADAQQRVRDATRRELNPPAGQGERTRPARLVANFSPRVWTCASVPGRWTLRIGETPILRAPATPKRGKPMAPSTATSHATTSKTRIARSRRAVAPSISGWRSNIRLTLPSGSASPAST